MKKKKEKVDRKAEEKLLQERAKINFFSVDPKKRVLLL